MSDVNSTERQIDEENRFRSDKLDRQAPASDDARREGDMLDEALEDSFPASDPASPARIDGPAR